MPSRFTVASTKGLVHGAPDGDVAAHAAPRATLVQECFVGDDHREDVAAVLERRDPRFIGT